jgi:hypothetical protein
MTNSPAKISLDDWAARYPLLKKEGLRETPYGGPLERHLQDGDLRLRKLRFDNSPAALRLWNFLLTEEDRLAQARAEGKLLVGAMKDLGTVPVMAYSLPNAVAFYPDGAWWVPCVMELGDRLLEIADSLGIDDSFCPVRAMLGAFLNCEHFPIPDLLISSAGAVCDDFSAIAQRLEHLGYPIVWWEVPHRRLPDKAEEGIVLPGGFKAPAEQLRFLKAELERIRVILQERSGESLSDTRLSEGIRSANRVRGILRRLREKVFSAPRCPLPALEMLIAEMLAIHFCSDREESAAVLADLLGEVERRVSAGQGVLPEDAARVFWVNPVADLRAMNLLEECGGRICGTEYLFRHALEKIPEDVPPMDALAATALSDPMIGPVEDRAALICDEARAFGCEAVIISRIPGASHCAFEGGVIREIVAERLGLPVVEFEVPPVSDSLSLAMRTRMEALVETIRERRAHVLHRD